MRGTPCTALVSRTADDGTVEILGCVAKKGSKTIRIRAKKAVVMATGGFDWNQQMMKSYLRTPARHSWGCSTDTGDGHKMAMRVGADMNMMSEGWLSPGYKKEFDESRAAEASNLSSLIMDDAKRGIIFVNKHGKRFTNECANYDSVGRSFCAIENDGEERGWKNLPAFAIIDQAAADNHTFNKGELGKPGKASPASKRSKSSPMHAESTSSPFSLKFPVTTKTPRWDWIRISNEVRTTTLNNRLTRARDSKELRERSLP